MAESPIRHGIIGCAWIAAKIARAIDLAPNSTLYAIGSRSIQKAELFAAKNGVSESVKIYGSYEQVIDDPCVDVVYLPLPTSLHVHWAVLAANRKKHLLVEKPTALDVAELDRILGACELNGVQFMDGSMWLHHPRTHELQKMMSDSSVFGNINFETVFSRHFHLNRGMVSSSNIIFIWGGWYHGTKMHQAKSPSSQRDSNLIKLLCKHVV